MLWCDLELKDGVFIPKFLILGMRWESEIQCVAFVVESNDLVRG